MAAAAIPASASDRARAWASGPARGWASGPARALASGPAGVGVGAGFFVGVGLGLLRRASVPSSDSSPASGSASRPHRPGSASARGPGVAGTPGSGVGDGCGATRLGIASPSSGPLPGGASAAGDGPSSPDGDGRTFRGRRLAEHGARSAGKDRRPDQEHDDDRDPHRRCVADQLDARRFRVIHAGRGGGGPPTGARSPATTIRVGPTGAGRPSSRRCTRSASIVAAPSAAVWADPMRLLPGWSDRARCAR